MRKYRLVAKKGEGTFSEVLKAQNVKDGKYHAIKCMKNRFENIDQVNNLREIQALRRLSPHEHIISLEEVLYDQPTGRLALVFELMDANLYELIKGRRQYLSSTLVKSYMWQLMKSLDHMHKKGIFHRDIKPENILIESSTEIVKGLKLADLGSCRGIYSKQPYTEYISTRWYRAPECLLTDGYYGPEMDMWGAGCVMFEITSLYPLFPGSNEVDQISRIHKVLGTPTAEKLAKFREKGASHISFDFPTQKGIGIPQLIPQVHPDCVDLIVKLLKYDASDRISAREALRHPYFKDVRENEATKNMADSHNANSTTNQSSSNSKQSANLNVAEASPKKPTVNPYAQAAQSTTTGHPAAKQQTLPVTIPQATQQKSAYSVGGSMLPPINNPGASANSAAPTQYQSASNKYYDPKSGRNGNLPSNNNSKKVRKKYRTNYNAQGAQHQQQKKSSDVMQAYGVSAASHNRVLDPSAPYGNGSSSQHNHGHRQNRQYVNKK